MPTITRLVPLSGAPLGLPIPTAAVIATPGVLIHTVSASANDIDRLTLKVHNLGVAPFNFFVDVADRHFVFRDIPPQSAEYMVIEAMPLVGAATPTLVHAWASIADVALVTGDVIRVTQT